jgi:hypothetical protein
VDTQSILIRQTIYRFALLILFLRDKFSFASYVGWAKVESLVLSTLDMLQEMAPKFSAGALRQTVGPVFNRQGTFILADRLDSA